MPSLALDVNASPSSLQRRGIVSTSAASVFEDDFSMEDGRRSVVLGDDDDDDRDDGEVGEDDTGYDVVQRASTKEKSDCDGDPAASGTARAFRRRLESFSEAVESARATFGELASAGWVAENRKIVVKATALLAFAIAFYVALVMAFAHVWIEVATAIGVRVLRVILAAMLLALAPPIFPNAAAHALALVLMFAEIALLSVNAVLLAMVHLAIVLNKYVLPSWYHRARVKVRESAGGVDHKGRANAHYSKLRQETLAELERTETYEAWRTIANKLDAFPAEVGEGGSAWKLDDKSDAYDKVLVKVYLNTMKTARERGDITSLGLCLRTVLHRNFAGIDRLLHLRSARVGTKVLVQAFNDEIVAAIEYMSTTDDEETAREMLKVLRESYRSLGRTALCLSGGGALAMYHFGVLLTLLRQGLCPQVISGTSGGSIVAAFLACHSPKDIVTSIRSDVSTRFGRRWFPLPIKMALHFLKHGVLMDEAGFSKTTKAYFGDTTFEEGFAISGLAVSIQVSIGSQTGYVLNHLTSPNVLIRTAVCASCALPGLMRPVEILAKDKNGNLIPFHPPDVKSYDGTITQDIPSARMTELFNCNNFIVSQVNPHLNFVLHLAEESHGRKQKSARSYQRRNAVQKLLRVANFLLLNIKYSIQKLLEVDLLDIRFVRTLQGVLMQDFRGHITILPSLTWTDYSKILLHPTEMDMQRYIARGEQSTWPHIEAIRYTMRIEHALVDGIRALTRRTDTSSPANKAKRQNSHGFLEH